jgi:hypothetical protein
MDKKRNRPGGRSQAAPTSTAAEYLNFSPDRRHATPSTNERREAELLAELSEMGYTVAVSCTVCGHALTSSKSFARGHIGPKCAAKAVQP